MKVLIITLLNEPARAAHATKLADELRKQGLAPEVFRATDARTGMFRDIDYVASSDQPIRMIPGELGCAWSHVRACQAVRDSGEPAFVVEDDAYLLGKLSEVSVGKVDEFLSLSCWNPHEPHNKRMQVVNDSGEHLETLGLPYGTQCYYITPKGATRFLEHAVPVKHPADLVLHHLSVRKQLRTFLSKSPIANQAEGFESYIGRR